MLMPMHHCTRFLAIETGALIHCLLQSHMQTDQAHAAVRVL
jgi:hypothetical protein